MGAIAIALNGVSIYSGAVDTQCGVVDVDDSSSEWTSFDMCGGHAESTGDYHYHFPPSCLVYQATAINPTIDGHSPQIGWAFDGFPIYGPIGADGVQLTQDDLDDCSGKEEEIPALDNFKYRYYMTGSTSDLTSLPGNPMPVQTDYPFSLNCYKGYTYDELNDGSTGETGVTDNYTAVATVGYSDQFDAYPADSDKQCSSASNTTDLSTNTTSTIDTTDLSDSICAVNNFLLQLLCLCVGVFVGFA
jgi:hypothetical protein